MSKRNEVMRPAGPSRRVYAREFETRTGWGDTWVRHMEDTGRIPRGRKDAGAKRRWWPNDEVELIVSGKWPGLSAPRDQEAA